MTCEQRQLILAETNREFTKVMLEIAPKNEKYSGKCLFNYTVSSSGTIMSVNVTPINFYECCF